MLPRAVAEVRVSPRLLQKSAWLGASTMGIWVVVQLVEQFENVLKPFVLATMFAGCLEYFVQLCEGFFKRTKRIFCCVICCRCCRCRQRRPADQGAPLLGDKQADSGCIQIPEDVLETWSEKDAGKYFFVRLISVFIVLTGTFITVSALVSAIATSFDTLDMDVYLKGFQELENAALELLRSTPDSVKNQVQTKFNQFQTEASATALNLVNDILASTTNWFMQGAMFSIYALMYLLSPVDSSKEIFLIVRTYLMYKCFCNALFAASFLALLIWIRADLALVASVMVFFLGFIPEVGAFISLAIPLPLLLLDSRLEMKDRLGNVFVVSMGMLLIKFLVSNGIESIVMGKSKILAGVVDSESSQEETHPVVILLFVVLCGHIWGVVGMLVSVPLISLIRLVLNYEEQRQSEASVGGIRRASIVADMVTGLFGVDAESLDDTTDEGLATGLCPAPQMQHQQKQQQE
eukprot:TRINITY_DN51437_c0_g1_i1.p1 TRINITY_DN51437_c0_g1~~TRINITY_DN51437_c0_g1_i1.p1  ORF type:complete len:482 (+),score=84.46 TRINITY_DN51437_c0_g1_i1:60-1448(+)